ncbi:MAG: spermidine synthase [Bacillota bacterium]|nr:spermidine synthase [Bacillota bacterium]
MELWYTEKHTETVDFSIKVKRHFHSETSAFQQIDFFESEEFGIFFTLDGLMMVNEKDEFVYHDMITHVALATNPEIKRVLVIGGGDGGTVRELTRYKHIEAIDMVEIDERVVRACQEHLPLTSSKLTDPRVKLYFRDGLAFVNELAQSARASREHGASHKNDCSSECGCASPKLYDLILVDSTDPIGPGEGLFSDAFYRDCFDALSERGILVNQHESPYYPNYAHEMKRAHQKIKKHFPISRVYQFHMPTYPSGHWLFGFASKQLDPIVDHKPEVWEAFGIDTKYYNSDLHKGCFALPTFVKKMLAYDADR